ncbi:hypothetical protein HNY73_021322 [Argiope bruennichi]|uniref:Uncharacterized protein n=1 Tax=Argiope bruennichi TaxID=94029 RepID=A0A8T0DZ86_ARGBR|nr:hypothetical protein HNY73_021322 [Argiope bruennichi]
MQKLCKGSITEDLPYEHAQMLDVPDALHASVFVNGRNIDAFLEIVSPKCLLTMIFSTSKTDQSSGTHEVNFAVATVFQWGGNNLQRDDSSCQEFVHAVHSHTKRIHCQ